ncbi:hypothetical protein [Campylobacter ureolyticus]|uniref:Uncharacterized protein n=1 Tax=Campylobacter ureolyticus TaxID=827 RepID=A0A6N2QZE4_9BACT
MSRAIRRLKTAIEKIEKINLNTLIDKTSSDLKNAKSLDRQYASHNDLINELIAEIKANQ